MKEKYIPSGHAAPKRAALNGGVMKKAAAWAAAALLALTAAGCAAGHSGSSRASSSLPSQSAVSQSPSSSQAVSSQASSAVPSSAPAASSSATQPVTGGGRVICVDPGHQTRVDMGTEAEAPGSDVMKVKNPGGAEGTVTGTPEYELDLAVSLKLRALLEARGYKVVMTRTTNDVDLGSNIARAQIANNCAADLFVRVHADGVDDSGVKGISVQVPGAGYIKDAALLGASKKAAGYVLAGMVNATGARSRGLAERDDMTGFNWCTRPMMLVEMGFMSNPDEDRLMATDSYRQKLAEGMANGIDAYFAAA